MGPLLHALPALLLRDVGRRPGHQPDRVLHLLRAHADPLVLPHRRIRVRREGKDLLHVLHLDPLRRPRHAGRAHLPRVFSWLLRPVGPVDPGGPSAGGGPAIRVGCPLRRPLRQDGRLRPPRLAAARARRGTHAHQCPALPRDDRNRGIRPPPVHGHSASFRLLHRLTLPAVLGLHHNPLRRAHGPRAGRHQAAPGLLQHQPDGLHLGGHSVRQRAGLRRRHTAVRRPWPGEGDALHGGRRAHHADGHAFDRQAGRARKEDAVDGHPSSHRLPHHNGRPTDRRVHLRVLRVSGSLLYGQPSAAPPSGSP